MKRVGFEMSSKVKAVAAIAGVMALSGCIEEAHIASPSAVASSTERLELRGMGGARKGNFELGSSSGEFMRSSRELGGFGFVDKAGGGSFTLTGPLVDGELSGRCRFHEQEVSLGSNVSVLSAPVIYSCVFDRGGRPIEADLVLEQASDSAAAMARYERKGELRFEGQRIALRSIHHFEGGKLPTRTPLGYSFSENGREIGAIDLNGGNKTIFAPRDQRQREAIVAASLALSVFWDPADS
jgi:hypothetical protein